MSPAQWPIALDYAKIASTTNTITARTYKKTQSQSHSQKLYSFFAIASTNPHKTTAPQADVVLVASSVSQYDSDAGRGNITHRAGI